uniref:Uncharacterized protein n=1 Tax=Anopheles quadriannulatus TaxID=34691 RepID=A0A182XR19_ANOQN
MTRNRRSVCFRANIQPTVDLDLEKEREIEKLFSYVILFLLVFVPCFHHFLLLLLSPILFHNILKTNFITYLSLCLSGKEVFRSCDPLCVYVFFFVCGLFRVFLFNNLFS